MTRFVALALLALGPACMAAPPEPLALDDAATLPSRELQLPAYEVVPDRVLPPAPPPPAVPEPLVDEDLPRVAVNPQPYVGTGVCPLSIEGSGFPAIDAQNDTIVDWMREPIEGERSRDMLVFFAAGKAPRSVKLYEDTPDTGKCERVRQTTQARLDAVQAELDARTWRPLEAMAFETDVDALDPSERELPWREVELRAQGGKLELRRFGQVFEHHTLPRWTGPLDADADCTDEPEFETLWFDRESRRALLVFGYACEETLRLGFEISQAAIDAADDVDHC